MIYRHGDDDDSDHLLTSHSYAIFTQCVPYQLYKIAFKIVFPRFMTETISYWAHPTSVQPPHSTFLTSCTNSHAFYQDQKRRSKRLEKTRQQEKTTKGSSRQQDYSSKVC